MLWTNLVINLKQQNIMAQRGRPKGSISFVNVNLAKLNELFGAQQNIPISRVWLKKLNIDIDGDNNPVLKSEPSAASSQKIEMSLAD